MNKQVMVCLKRNGKVNFSVNACPALNATA